MKRSVPTFHLLFSLILLLCVSQNAWSESGHDKVLRLGCLSADTSPDTLFLKSIIEPVLSEHGYSLKIEHLPGPVIEQKVLAGELDGDCGRDQSTDYRLKNVTKRLEPAFRNATLTIWGHADKVEIPNQQLRFGYPQGWKTFTPVVERFGYGEVRTYPDLKDLPGAVARGEIDAFLTYDADIVFNLDTLNDANLTMHRHVLSIPIYLYLRPDYEDLFADLSAAIADVVTHSPYIAMKTGPRKQNHIEFSCSMPPKFPLFEQVRLFYTQAFEKLGYSFSMIHLPRAREVAELLSGRVDGSCGRGIRASFIKKPQLRVVDVPVGRSARQLISTTAGITSLDDIPPQSEVYYVRGTQSRGQVLNHPNLQTKGVSTIENGLKMMAAGRIHYLVDTSVLLEDVRNFLQLDQNFHRTNLSEAYAIHPILNLRHSRLREPLEQQMLKQLAVWPNQLLFDHERSQ